MNMTSKICVLVNKKSDYIGVIFGKNPWDHVVPTLMLQVILSVSLSRVIHVILSPLRQSKLTCDILAGVILGPSVLGRNETYMKKMFSAESLVVLATLTQMSVYLYMFVVYIKAEAAMLTRAAKSCWKLWLCCLIIPSALTSFVGLWERSLMPNKTAFPIQLGVALSSTYFVVITRALDELNILSSELGELSTCITCLNESFGVAVLLVSVASAQKEIKHSVFAVLSLCSLVMFATFVIRPILFWIIKNTPKGKPVKECHVVAVILLMFLMGVITDAIGLTFVAASIIMGFIIPDGPPLGATIVRKCELIVYEILLPLFFVRIGYYTDFSKIQDGKHFMVFGAAVGVEYLGRLVACLLVSSSMNMKKNNAVFLSLILSLQGVVELIQGLRWRNLRLIDEQTFASIVLFTVVLNAIITTIIAFLYKPVAESFNVPTSSRVRRRSLATSTTVGELPIITCIQEEDNVPSIISLLEAMNPSDVSPICAYVIHLVAVCSQSVPKLAPYKNHLRKFSHPSGSDNIIRAFLNYAEHSQGPVQIHSYRLISPYKYMHQHICRLGETIRTPLVIVPFFKSEETGHDTDGTLRIFNTNIQVDATCTVGLLVDRGLRSPISLTTFSYNMAVIFLGGVDDREALALASRACRQPNVRITVLRIDMSGSHIDLETKIERDVDNTLFKDFKALNVDNGNVVCNEFVPHNLEDLMKPLRSLSKDYDLVIVGKRHGIPELEALDSWVHYPELGRIGDAFAAPDFMGERMSVLVLQHHDENQRVLEN